MMVQLYNNLVMLYKKTPIARRQYTTFQITNFCINTFK